VNLLQLGNGAFGETHLRAWRALGEAPWVFDPDPAARARAEAAGCRALEDWRPALAAAEAVTVLGPSDTHFALAQEVLTAGKPVFIEKPATATAAEAETLHRLAGGAVAMVGMYFRFHPRAIEAKRRIAAGTIGRIWALSGRFAGFKRARRDAGVLRNDAIHFLDLMRWLVGGMPSSVHAVLRDHSGRGLEDFALLTLTWENGPAAQLEVGLVQPGRWPDAVVPGAITDKRLTVTGSEGALEIDFAAEAMTAWRARHHLADAKPPELAREPVGAWPADPVAVVAAELAHFRDCVRARRAPESGLMDAGVDIMRLIEAAERSSALGQAVRP